MQHKLNVDLWVWQTNQQAMVVATTHTRKIVGPTWRENWTKSPLCGGIGGRAPGSCNTPLRPITYMHHMTLHGFLPHRMNCVTRSDRHHLLLDRQDHQPWCRLEGDSTQGNKQAIDAVIAWSVATFKTDHASKFLNLQNYYPTNDSKVFKSIIALWASLQHLGIQSNIISIGHNCYGTYLKKWR